jgi:lipopolysaccharide export system permease protein
MILYRYILREFFRFASGTLFLCLFFFILFDFIQKTAGYLGRYNPPARLLSQYYLMQLPFEIYQGLPIASLIASVVVMMMLARAGEATAMMAAGVSPLRMAKPLAIGGLILSVLSFLLGEFVIPYSSRQAHYIKQVAIEGENAGLSEGAYWMRSQGYTVNFKSYNSIHQTLEGVKMLSLSKENFAPSRTIHARTASYSPAYNTWVLHNVVMFRFNRDKKVIYNTLLPFLIISLPIQPQTLKFDRRLPFELSLSEISSIIETGQQTNGDILSYRVAWHMKFAYPFAAFLICFLGLRFAYKAERTRETLRGMFLALTLALTYWFILSMSKALCSSGSMHPFFAGWLANAWVFIVITFQFVSLYRGQK